MSKYLKGRRYEYLVKDKLEKEGYIVIRASGSHGKWDLVAVHPVLKDIRLIQIKYKKNLKSKIISSIYGKYMVYDELMIIGGKSRRKKCKSKTHSR
jgi:Holliday junction resolvase